MKQDEKREVVYRHSGAVRATHWVNVIALLVLLMSGLQIFNAHPALYLGSKSNFDDPVMAMRPMKHGQDLVGVTTVAGWNIDTTNLFDLAYDEVGDYQIRGFPWSVTLPGHRDLATGRRWHFFFAWLFVINGLIYLIYSLVSGHLRKDLAPSGPELKHIGASIWEHLRLKFPQGEEAKRYNVLQKLAYLVVALVLLPLMLLTGLAMSPGMDAGYPFLLEIFGGRQSAHHPFHRRERHRAVRGGAHRHGADLRRVEQPSLHDHRPLRDQSAGEPGMSAKPKLDRRGFLTRRPRHRQRCPRRRLRQRAFRAALGQAHSRQGGGAHLCEPAGARLAEGARPRI
jgi:thiosulfate reductase cytochrome b subunit